MNDLSALLAQPLLTIGTHVVSIGMGMVLMAGAFGFLSLLAIIALVRSRAARLRAEHDSALRAAEAEARMADILKSQNEMQGRIAAMTEVFGARQAELNQSLSQRLDGMSHRLGATLNEQTKTTHDNLARLQERLAVIDTAQNNIQALARDVVGLQAILSNKQTRGAFGQSRMETIVADGLPMGAYEFQATLSNGMRPDCLIAMPNGQPRLVIDAKFPLEAWNGMRDGQSMDDIKLAVTRFRHDIDVHIRDIAQKYLIRGETQDTAFLFVPSESIFAEIHEKHENIVQKAHRSRIVIVSPSLLMLSIQVIQAVLRDVRMREQAHLIQGEVAHLMDDLGRLSERVGKLQGHFALAQRDVEQIVTSSDKLVRRGEKIEAMDFSETPRLPDAGQSEPAPASPAQRSVDSRTGQLKFRVVDED